MWVESKDQRAAWRDPKGESLCGRHQCGLGKRVTEREDRGRVVSLAPAQNGDHKAPPSRESYPDLGAHIHTAISEYYRPGTIYILSSKQNEGIAVHNGISKLHSYSNK